MSLPLGLLPVPNVRLKQYFFFKFGIFNELCEE